MCGRPRLVGLLWLACLVAGALCLTAGGDGQKPGEVVTLHHQQTIVTLHLTGDGELTRCDTIEVNFPDQERKALATLRREQRTVTAVTLQRMLETLVRCQKLDYVRRRRQHDGQSAPQPHVKWDSATLLRGLVPGTKWCGLGDTAEGWNDLGPNVELDLCCRTHDLCPVKVKAYKRRYDLFNWGVYTKSHCACDQEFYRCLKLSSAREADQVGSLFFDLLQPQCVQGRMCAPHESADACLERQKSEGGPEGLRFFDQLQGYEEKAIPPLVAVSAGGSGGGKRDGEGQERDGAGSGTEEGNSGGEQGSGAEKVVQTANVGLQGAPSGGGGGVSSFFRKIWNKFG